MKQLACGDLMPGCDFVATAETESELLQEVAAHARDAHGIAEVSPELVAKVKSKIVET